MWYPLVLQHGRGKKVVAEGGAAGAAVAVGACDERLLVEDAVGDAAKAGDDTLRVEKGGGELLGVWGVDERCVGG